jgi:hypothetical protein
MYLSGSFGTPVKHLCHAWNWKSALLSSILRASLFFATNLSAGFPAAMAAWKTELVFRGITSGFYGALTEAFREAEPPWTAALAAMLLLPLANHSIELLVHWIRGTQNLFSSILASVVLTALSTLFNFYLMPRGALIVGSGRGSLRTDLARMPKLALDFIAWLPAVSGPKVVRRLQVRIIARRLRHCISPIRTILLQEEFGLFITRSERTRC